MFEKVLPKDAKDSLKKEELVLKDSPVVYQKMEWNEIEKGDWVLLKKFNKEASVLEINAEKRILTVLLGNIKIKVSVPIHHVVHGHTAQTPSHCAMRHGRALQQRQVRS